MKVTDVRAVIAIGLRGQFGLRGRLPWEGNRGREYVADVERFFELTRGHVVIMGQRTLGAGLCLQEPRYLGDSCFRQAGESAGGHRVGLQTSARLEFIRVYAGRPASSSDYAKSRNHARRGRAFRRQPVDLLCFRQGERQVSAW